MLDNELWTDFKTMLKDIKSNYSSKVAQDDYPLEHIFGYKSTIEDKFWHIKISDLKINIENENSASILFSIISSDEGKEKLLAALNEGK